MMFAFELDLDQRVIDAVRVLSVAALQRWLQEIHLSLLLLLLLLL